MIDNSFVKYNTSSIEECEYKKEMQKVYCDIPDIENGKCKGFRNKYNDKISKVCEKCLNFVEVKS